MNKRFLIAGVAVLAMAVPAVAAMHGEGQEHPAMKDMTRADVESKVKEHFAKIDADKDGTITKEEVKASREAMRAERSDRHFKAMDKDGDGSISRAEFDTAHTVRDGKRGEWGGKRRHQVHMMGGRMFDRADADKDGKITLAEASRAALARFDEMDTNKDGTVTAAERKEAMKAMREQWKTKTGKTD